MCQQTEKYGKIQNVKFRAIMNGKINKNIKPDLVKYPKSATGSGCFVTKA